MRDGRRFFDGIRRRNHEGSYVEFGRIDDVLSRVARTFTDGTNICGF
jgi:hypothetical protein